MKAIDLFAGARGWDIAARQMGWHVDGVEKWMPANATAALNGFTTVHKDVTTFHTTPGQYPMQIASPSCKKYSMSGGGAGRRALAEVLHGVQEYRHGRPMVWGDAVALVGDADAALTLEPLRIALEGEPTFIAWEQVPAVLPAWEACADVLRERGYSVATGVLNAEQYGVPQTRRRAVLMARRDGGTAQLPTPTHSRYHSRDPRRLDANVKPWVSMAEALGWSGQVEAVSNYGTGGDPRNRGIRHQDEPFSTVTSKTDRVVLRNGNQDHAAERDLDQPSATLFFGARANWCEWALRPSAQGRATVRPLDQPAATILGGNSWGERRWVYERPSISVLGDPRIDRPGHKDRNPGGEAMHAQSIKVTAEQAACLQTFPAGYEFFGTKGEVFQQIGNAVPPLLAEAILTSLTA
jgi:DNA (cytosine-5)-methyltransferase 1